jgi:hypothetical protein
MRMMMSLSFPVNEANAALKNGTLQEVMQQFLEEHKPEAAYFFPTEDGERGGFMILNMTDPSELVRFAEPFFLNLNARVRFKPVMSAEDLAKGVASIERATARN